MSVSKVPQAQGNYVIIEKIWKPGISSVSSDKFKEGKSSKSSKPDEPKIQVVRLLSIGNDVTKISKTVKARVATGEIVEVYADEMPSWRKFPDNNYFVQSENFILAAV